MAFLLLTALSLFVPEPNIGLVHWGAVAFFAQDIHDVSMGVLKLRTLIASFADFLAESITARSATASPPI